MATRCIPTSLLLYIYIYIYLHQQILLDVSSLVPKKSGMAKKKSGFLVLLQGYLHGNLWATTEVCPLGSRIEDLAVAGGASTTLARRGPGDGGADGILMDFFKKSTDRFFLDGRWEKLQDSLVHPSCENYSIMSKKNNSDGRQCQTVSSYGAFHEKVVLFVTVSHVWCKDPTGVDHLMPFMPSVHPILFFFRHIPSPPKNLWSVPQAAGRHHPRICMQVRSPSVWLNMPCSGTCHPWAPSMWYATVPGCVLVNVMEGGENKKQIKICWRE